MARMLIAAVIGLLPLTAIFSQATSPPAFEVASVKPSLPGIRPPAVRLAPNGHRLTAADASVRRLIMRAYSIADWQISGGPGWIDGEKFDIDARPERPVSSEQLYAMLRTLLAERFKLTMHRETVERPMYVLLLDKAAPKIQKHQPGNNDQEMHNWEDSPGIRHAKFNNVGMSTLAFFLTVQTGRDVVDKTGLDGRYDFPLNFAPIRDPGDGGSLDRDYNDSSGPSIFNAVRQQLGLRMDSQRGPVGRFHIDRVEKPSEN